MTILLLVACNPHRVCPEGEVRRDGACWPYEAGDPVPSQAWSPDPGTTWQIQYTGEMSSAPDVSMFDVDLFDTDQTFIDGRRAAGQKVICYFSAGSYEEWRSDADQFPASALGEPLEGWPGEWWVDITNSTVRTIMAARIELAGERGCTGVDPDNVNGWTNPTGLNLSATDQLEYNRFLADIAHARDLSVGLKNDIEQVGELERWFDWALNEECVDFAECDPYEAFLDRSKAAFHIEYVDDWADAEARADAVCGEAPGLDTLIKTWELGPEFLACPTTIEP